MPKSVEDLTEDLIQKMENDRSVSLEDFYRGLMVAIELLQDRLQCSKGDGIDLNEL